MTELSLAWATAEPVLALVVVGLAFSALAVIAHSRLWRVALLTGTGMGLLMLATSMPG